MSEKTEAASHIEALLRAALAPERLDVRDVSVKHAGHAGARPGGGTHFEVEVTAAAFTGRSRLERHRLVMEPLKAAFADHLHALQIFARAPGET